MPAAATPAASKAGAAAAASPSAGADTAAARAATSSQPAPTPAATKAPVQGTGGAWSWVFEAADLAARAGREPRLLPLGPAHRPASSTRRSRSSPCCCSSSTPRDRPERWVLLATLAAVALFFLVLISRQLAGRRRLRRQPLLRQRLSGLPLPGDAPHASLPDRGGLRGRRSLPRAAALHAVRRRRPGAHAPGPRAQRAVPPPAARAVAAQGAGLRQKTRGRLHASSAGATRSFPRASASGCAAPTAWRCI